MNASPESDEHLVAEAKAGGLKALDTLVRRHQSWIFNLALRMVWRRDEAEDATQEILLKAVTHLATFEGRSTFRTWLYRVAVNHLLRIRKSEMEAQEMSFTDMAASLESVIEEELPDPRTLPVETGLLVEEAKWGCMTAMLMCLDRRQRLAFILGEVFGESSENGAVALEVSPENFRQLLSRARRDLYQFMAGQCGLVNQANPCRCARKTSGFMRKGWLDARNLQFSKDRLSSVAEQTAGRLEELQDMDQQHGWLYRHQPFLAGTELAVRLRELLSRSTFAKE